MYKYQIIWLFIFTANVLSSIGTETIKKPRLDTLEFVQVIFRHGDRAPTHLYPNNPHNSKFNEIWPEGFARLTQLGKLQQRGLGQFLRERYDGFIGNVYNPAEIYFTSSDMDRTINSLQFTLAGLFSHFDNVSTDNHNDKLFSTVIDKQCLPIPLNPVPQRKDRMLMTNAKCRRYRKLRKHITDKSDIAVKMNKKYRDFMKYCEKHSGLRIKKVKDLYPLYDILHAQSAHNLSLPPWVRHGRVLQKLEEVQSILNTISSFNDEMKRLRGGPFLKLLIKNMETVAYWRFHFPQMRNKNILQNDIDYDLKYDNDDDEVHSVRQGIPRMILYSGHDSTLNRMMNTMDIFDPHCPPYNAALLIELHQNPVNSEYFIEFYYRNDTTTQPYQLKPKRCPDERGSQLCDLKTFVKAYEHLIPTDWERECQ